MAKHMLLLHRAARNAGLHPLPTGPTTLPQWLIFLALKMAVWLYSKDSMPWGRESKRATLLDPKSQLCDSKILGKNILSHRGVIRTMGPNLYIPLSSMLSVLTA